MNNHEIENGLSFVTVLTGSNGGFSKPFGGFQNPIWRE
jgi:hypothetical protein